MEIIQECLIYLEEDKLFKVSTIFCSFPSSNQQFQAIQQMGSRENHTTEANI